MNDNLPCETDTESEIEEDPGVDPWAGGCEAPNPCACNDCDYHPL